jgi:hypothetical protein
MILIFKRHGAQNQNFDDFLSMLIRTAEPDTQLFIDFSLVKHIGKRVEAVLSVTFSAACDRRVIP